MRFNKSPSPVGATSARPATGKSQSQDAITEALANYRGVQAQLPANADLHYKIAKTLRLMDKNDDAEAAYRRAIELQPTHVAALTDCADLLLESGRSELAIPLYQAALLLEQNSSVALHGLGTALRAIGHLELAMDAYGKMLANLPNSAVAHNNVGSIQQAQGQIEEAMQSFRRALELDPRLTNAHYNLGICLTNLGRFDESLASTEKALQIDPGHLQANTNMSSVLFTQGHKAEAINHASLALKDNPQWEYLHSNLLFYISHSEQCDPAEMFAEHLRFGAQFEAPLRAGWPRHANVRDPERRLRVGFVSADLHSHAVASFITPIMENLCHAPGLEIFAYANSLHDDAVSRHLQELVSVWRQVELLSHEELAQMITSDAIDILVDLSGHTGHNRLLAFARKPAPLQASWIGYPGTTGLQAMDYYLSDRFFSPPGLLDDQLTEKLVCLPASAPFLPAHNAPAINHLPASKNGHITFGSFNRASKLSIEVVACWSRLLRALPGARMLLAAMPDTQVSDRLRSWFASEGISADRLSFHGRTNTHDYLALHHLVDICLDTFPYTGGTTTCHALWMGVPTLTMPGRSLPGRASAAVNLQMGLNDFIARDVDDFVSKGVQAAGNIAHLAALRAEMRARVENAPMGQPALIAAGVELAMRTMWQRWCDNLPAESFEVEIGQGQHQRRSLGINSQQEVNVEAAILLAIEHHQAGRFVEAETLYIAVIRSQPQHAIANHNMGLLAGQLGFHDKALDYLQAAFSAHPSEHQFCLSYAQGLLQAGLPLQALDVINNAIANGMDEAAAQATLQRIHAAITPVNEFGTVQTEQYPTPGGDAKAGSAQQDAAPTTLEYRVNTASANPMTIANMNISTEDNFLGVSEDNPYAKQFLVLSYADGSFSTIPHQFFRDWLDEEPQFGSFYIGRCSGLGVGSLVKYDSNAQSLCIGRYVAGGLRLRFLLNGQHESRTISTSMFSAQNLGLRNAPPPQYADSIIKNDVWLGDEVMMLGGGIIENGCIIGARSLLPPNFRSEPYGIYAGSPARLIRFRFSEKVRAALLELAWWEMPLTWLKENNDYFLLDMTAPDEQVLPIIALLRISRDKFLAEATPDADI